MLQVENLNKSFGSKQVLFDINFKADNGKILGLIGKNGSGKTTLIKLLLRELLPTKGTIMVDNKDLTKLKRREVPKMRRKIGVVFQNFRLLKDLTVYENVAFAQRVIEAPAHQIRRQVPSMLTMVGLADKYRAYPKQLSGGEQQRVAIARALVNEPPILIADDPTGNLDPENSVEIMKMLDEINKRGTTVVVVTHNQEIVNMMQKRVITLKKGKIISDEEKGGYTYD